MNAENPWASPDGRPQPPTSPSAPSATANTAETGSGVYTVASNGDTVHEAPSPNPQQPSSPDHPDASAAASLNPDGEAVASEAGSQAQPQAGVFVSPDAASRGAVPESGVSEIATQPGSPNSGQDAIPGKDTNVVAPHAAGNAFANPSGNTDAQDAAASQAAPGNPGSDMMQGKDTNSMAPHEPQASPTQPVPQPGAQYGANQFWGQPGFNDPLAAAKPLQTSATWGGAADSRARRRGPGWFGVIGIAVAASLISTGGFYAVTSNLPAKAEASKSTLFNPEDKGVSTPAPVANSTSQNPDWESVAKAVRPAVVAIMVRAGRGGDQGSGAIIDSSGHILTNNHVVAAAADGNGQIFVELSDGRLYKAEIVGRDVLTDLAVIKIVNPPKDLTVVALGDSSKLRVGEAVAAIGNPLGLSSTVTTGIVSALNRPVRVDAVPGGNQDQDEGLDLRDLFGGRLGGGMGGGLGGGSDDGLIRPRPKPKEKVTTNAIQVDAAVNPGNSGGPLFDAKGRVVGVTSSIASLSSGGFGGGQGGSIGLGFAIPINQAQMIATQLIEHGQAVHAALGITIDEGIATVGDVSRLGAAVQEIVPGGSAEKSGLKVGDIIVGIDGKQVKGSESLIGWVRQYSVGDTVELQIVRDGKEMKVSVTLKAQ